MPLKPVSRPPEPEYPTVHSFRVSLPSVRTALAGAGLAVALWAGGCGGCSETAELEAVDAGVTDEAAVAAVEPTPESSPPPNQMMDGTTSGMPLALGLDQDERDVPAPPPEPVATPTSPTPQTPPKPPQVPTTPVTQLNTPQNPGPKPPVVATPPPRLGGVRPAPVRLAGRAPSPRR